MSKLSEAIKPQLSVEEIRRNPPIFNRKTGEWMVVPKPMVRRLGERVKS